MQREQFEEIIRSMIVKRAAKERPEREMIYAAARSSLRRRPNISAKNIAELDAAIDTVETTFLPRVKRLKVFDLSKATRIAAIALLLGIALGAGVSALVHAPAATASSNYEASAFEELKQIYSVQVALMPEAIGFIRRVMEEIGERQKRDKDSLETASKKFVPLRTFDPGLAKKMPKSLPPGTSIMLRANATDQKVLMNWTLCGVASISKPEMVDRKRTRVSGIGCPFFGLWTDGAAKW